MYGGRGNDQVFGSQGFDRVFGGRGNGFINVLDERGDVVDCGGAPLTRSTLIPRMRY